MAGTAHLARNSRFALARYRRNGNLDTGFAGDGKVTTNLRPRARLDHDDPGNALALQEDGRVVIGGYSGGSHRLPDDFAIARYLVK